MKLDSAVKSSTRLMLELWQAAMWPNHKIFKCGYSQSICLSSWQFINHIALWNISASSKDHILMITQIISLHLQHLLNLLACNATDIVCCRSLSRFLLFRCLMIQLKSFELFNDDVGWFEVSWQVCVVRWEVVNQLSRLQVRGHSFCIRPHPQQHQWQS